MTPPARAVQSGPALPLEDDLAAQLTLIEEASERLLASSSRQSYLRALTRYRTWRGKARLTLDSVTAKDAVRYRLTLRREGLKDATINALLSPVRALHLQLSQEQNRASPFAGIHSPIRNGDIPMPFAEEELRSLLETVTAQEEVLLLLGAHAGLRASEAAGVCWKDLDLPNRSLQVTGKGDRTRRVTLSRSLMDALERLRAELQAHDRPAPEPADLLLGVSSRHGVNRALQALCRRANVQQRGYHSLRRRAGSELLRQTHSLQAVQGHLGHANIATSARYTRYVNEHDSEVGSW